MELQGDELSANEMLGHGSKHANLAPSQMLCEEERGFLSTPNETKSICSSQLLCFIPTWELQ